MTIAAAHPNEILDLSSHAENAPAAAGVLVDSERLTVTRIALASGKQTAVHRAPGELTIVCLEGTATFTAQGVTQDMSAGQFVYLPNRESHALQARTDCVLLLTVAVTDGGPPNDLVDEASRESFPASDPPARTPFNGP